MRQALLSLTRHARQQEATLQALLEKIRASARQRVHEATPSATPGQRFMAGCSIALALFALYSAHLRIYLDGSIRYQNTADFRLWAYGSGLAWIGSRLAYYKEREQQ